MGVKYAADARLAGKRADGYANGLERWAARRLCER